MNNTNTALIVVDFQNDFCEGGSLAVPGANKELAYKVNQKMAVFYNRNLPVVLTLDWHPKNHCSFNIWPVHCVAGTRGAEIFYGIDKHYVSTKIHKGMDVSVDQYGAFGGISLESHHSKSTGLYEYLHAIEVTEVHICGIALDYCVAETAKQAATRFDSVKILWDCSVGIDTVGMSKEEYFEKYIGKAFSKKISIV